MISNKKFYFIITGFILIVIISHIIKMNDDKKKIESTREEIWAIFSCIEHYYKMNKKLPEKFEELKIIVLDVNVDFIDPWGNRFLYQKLLEGNKFKIISCGPNGKFDEKKYNDDLIQFYDFDKYNPLLSQ